VVIRVADVEKMLNATGGPAMTETPWSRPFFIRSRPLKERLGVSNDMCCIARCIDPVLPFPQPIRLGGKTRFARRRGRRLDQGEGRRVRR